MHFHHPSQLIVRQVKPEEIKAIVAHYADTGEPKKVFGTGFKIAGEKYVTIKADERSLYGKQVRNTPREPQPNHLD